jgi:hypothetical protein
MTMKTWLSLFLAILLLAPAAQASEKKNVEKGTEKEDTLGWRKPGPKHIQLSSVMAPVQAGRSTASVPITVVLKTVDEQAVSVLCGLTPRINDAVLAELYRKPIAMKADREMDLEEAGRRLKDPINRAVGKVLVDQSFIVSGTKKMGSGSLSRLPFASVFGCRELKLDGGKEEKEKKEEKDGKGGEKKH